MGENPPLSEDDIRMIAAQRGLLVAAVASVTPMVLDHLDWLSCWTG